MLKTLKNYNHTAYEELKQSGLFIGKDPTQSTGLIAVLTNGNHQEIQYFAYSSQINNNTLNGMRVVKTFPVNHSAKTIDLLGL